MFKYSMYLISESYYYYWDCVYVFFFNIKLFILNFWKCIVNYIMYRESGWEYGSCIVFVNIEMWK